MAKRINKAICHRFKKQRERENLARKTHQSRITDFFNSNADPNVSVTIEVDVNERNIEFFQINNQKRIMSNEEITRLAESTKSFCILGQEPSTFGYNVTGLNSRHTIVQAATDKPRSYIVCHKQLGAWPVEELCSRDVATAIIDSKMEEAGKLLVCSVYWDGRIDTFPEKAVEAAKLARHKNYTLVLGGDMNARSVLYGSSTDDRRGMKIEDFLLEYDLEPANRGTTPTCTASHPGSVIDATFVNGEKANLIKNWRVTKDETFSDHRLIRFSIQGPEIVEQKRRKMSPEQKESFTRATRGIAHQRLDIGLKDRVGTDDVEGAASDIVSRLVTAYHENSTQYTVKIKDKINLWFVEGLVSERKKHRALKHIYEHSKNDPAKREAWKNQERKLTALYKKAKKEEKEGSSNKIVSPFKFFNNRL